jgi:cell division protein FtsZ
MIAQKLEGAEFVVANTDAQALSMSKASRLGQAEPGESPTFA